MNIHSLQTPLSTKHSPRFLGYGCDTAAIRHVPCPLLPHPELSFTNIMEVQSLASLLLLVNVFLRLLLSIALVACVRPGSPREWMGWGMHPCVHGDICVSRSVTGPNHSVPRGFPCMSSGDPLSHSQVPKTAQGRQARSC